MPEKITLTNHSLERQIFLTRLIVGGAIALLLIGVLVARLFFLQIQEYEYYRNKSDNYRIHAQAVVPTRGLIYDRNGALLAENKTVSNLVLVKENAGDIDASIQLLRTLLAFSEEDEVKFRARLKRGRVPLSSVTVRLDLSEEEIAKIAVNQFRLPGISVEAQLVRHYPEGELFAHAVGYLSSITEAELQIYDSANYRGTTQVGKMGVEKQYEDILHGQVGYETVERNARGQIMKVLDRVDPTPGQDIVLNFDVTLQKAAVAAMGDWKGGVVVLDATDGGVLAMVSTPTFDPNLFVGGISQAAYAKLIDPNLTPMLNRAVAKYSPGSTVKPFVGLASLDLGVRTRDYTVNDPGYFRINGESHVFHDWTWQDSKGGHGIVDLQKAIYQSCNIYFYDLAVDLGIDPMHDFMLQFGFGLNTSIDISQASTGVLPSKQWLLESRGETWYPGHTLNSSIGQGFTEATTLQLATATMIMANQGEWLQPALLKRVGWNGADIVRENPYANVALNNISDWDFIAEAMSMVVHRGGGGYRDNGTAWAYLDYKNKLAYRMAGKSGTAQVVNGLSSGEDVAERNRSHALFIAYAPVENPQIAVAVLVEHGESGSGVAGPIAREIIDAYLLEEGELKPEFIMQPADAVIPATEDNSSVELESGISNVRVTDSEQLKSGV